MSDETPRPAIWTEWMPAQRWADFDGQQALSDAIWDSVSEPEWHYLNPAGGWSIWEARTDGSAIVIEYRDDRIVALQTSGGDAERHFLAVTSAFQLLAQAHADPSASAAAADNRPF